MPTNTCEITSAGLTSCIVCTGQPFVPSVPGHVRASLVQGWDAGANSVTELANDLEWSHAVPLGITSGVSGIRPVENRDSWVFTNITHGWWFARIGSFLLAQPVVAGARVAGEPAQINADAILMIRRIRGVVYHFIDDVPFGTPPRLRSFGPVVAGAMLYSSGDRIE